MVQSIKIICNKSLISDAFCVSEFIISDNRIIREIHVLAGKPEGRRRIRIRRRGWEYNIKMRLK